jgi:hypothetical protein
MKPITYRGCVHGTRVIPHRDRVRSPVHPRNGIVAARDEPHDVLPDHLVLVGVNVVDARYVDAHAGEDGLPARDAVGPHDGVGWGKFVAGVERRASRGHDFVATGRRGGAKHRLGAVGGQGFEIATEGGRYAIVTERQLSWRAPERIRSSYSS